VVACDRLVAISPLTLSSKLAAGKVFVRSPANALRFQYNQFELLATAAASSSSFPSLSSNPQMMIRDWTLVVAANLPLHISKRKDGCDETMMTATIREEMRMLMIVGHRPLFRGAGLSATQPQP